jgi:hypothetical protein
MVGMRSTARPRIPRADRRVHKVRVFAPDRPRSPGSCRSLQKGGSVVTTRTIAIIALIIAVIVLVILLM